MPPSPPPASITTSLLLLRGTIAGITGTPLLSTSESTPSPLQPTYLKERPRLTGKFSFPLGKRRGTACELDVSSSKNDNDGDDDDKDGETLVLDAIQSAVNRLISQDLPIRLSQKMTRSAAKDVYGEGIFDSSQKKTPKKVKPENDFVRLVFIEGVVVGAVGVDDGVLKSTGGIGAVAIERGNLASSVVGGKKARKCEIAIKFEVLQPAGESVVVAEEEEVSMEMGREVMTPLLEKKVRMMEGMEMWESQKREEGAKKLAEEQKAVEEQKAAQESSKAEEQEMVVNVEEVKGNIDYNKLIDLFGSQRLTPSLLNRLTSLLESRNSSSSSSSSKITTLHHFLTRGIFFSHRDFDKIIDCLEKQHPIYLYTGRGPSSAAMHMGHLVPFLFTKWLQEAFGCPLVIQMTDDEKFIFKGEYDPEKGDNLTHYRDLTTQNARDIIALGFDPQNTFLFSDLDYVGTMYPNIVRIWKACTTNSVSSLFGFDGTSNCGKIAFPAVQAAPSFSSSFPVVLDTIGDATNATMACLIPCAIDQDPYFRMTRDVAHKLVPKHHPLQGKPALIHSQFFPPLQGAQGKMSSSDPNSAVFLTDTPEDIERKIKEYAFSGGQETKKLQVQLGANLDVDVSYQWLKFFLEDEEELTKIRHDYGTGSGLYWSTAMVKTKLIEVVKEIVSSHQEKRAQVTDEVVKEFMSERRLGR